MCKNPAKLAYRQCTRPSPARVAISRIEKAWLREARYDPGRDDFTSKLTSVGFVLKQSWGE